jgi:hypothetical protein
VLLGLGVVGTFVLLLRWLPSSGSAKGVVGQVLYSAVTAFLVLLLATVLTALGTVALLTRRPRLNGKVSSTDLAFITVGILGSGVGVWVCTGLGLELILQW